MVKEVICIHLGQAGCQVGQHVWELFCAEHGIKPDGTSDETQSNDLAYESFFSRTSHGQHVPRAIFADTDPRSRDSLMNSDYSKLFHPNNVMGWKQDCKNNFFSGAQTAQHNCVVEDIVDRIRVLVDACDTLQGFFCFNSFGGGTGTGVGWKLLQAMRDQFDKSSIFQPTIFPSHQLSSCIVEPYNCIFAMHYTKDIVDLSLMLDNQKAYKMVSENLNIKNPDFKHLNCIIAQFMSACTTSLRFESQLNTTLPEIITNLVPFQGFRYPILSLAPLKPSGSKGHEEFRTEEIVTDLFSGKNILCDCDSILPGNRYIAAVVLLRGTIEVEEEDELTHKMVKKEQPIPFNAAMGALRNMVQPRGTHRTPVKFHPCFENGGFKVGVVSKPPTLPAGLAQQMMADTKRQGAMLGNTTAVRQLFVRQYTKFLHLFFHKAYVWQFLEADGEIDAFYEARESVRDLIQKYERLLDSCVVEENEKGGARVELKGRTR